MCEDYYSPGDVFEELNYVHAVEEEARHRQEKRARKAAKRERKRAEQQCADDWWDRGKNDNRKGLLVPW